MPTRPPPQPLPSSSSSSIPHPHRLVRTLYPLFANLSFHIVTAKLELEVAQIYACVDELGGRCVGVEEGQIVISAIRGRPRLIRSLGKEWVDALPILAPEFITDCYTLALQYAATTLPDLHHPPTLPPRTKYLVSKGAPFIMPYVGSRSPVFIDSSDDEAERKPAKRLRLDQDGIDGLDIKPVMTDLDKDMELYTEDVKLEDIPTLCVQRASPLVCPNQELVDAIRPVLEEREYEEAQQKNSNVLSYRRSLSVTVPRKLRSGKEAMKLLGVGDKVAHRVDEFLEKGYIRDSTRILASSRFQALNLFASVYTIGHHTAKDLYDRHHCRDLEDVRMHFEAVEEESPEVRLKDKLRRRRRGGMKQVEIVEEWIRLKDELDQKISREEVQEIADCVMSHLDAYVPGCEYTICGGYRRGKPQSSDVDIVFRPPGMEIDIGLLKNLYLRLSDLGIITHVLHVTHRDPLTPIHASPNNFDNLDKAFVIFKLPGPGRLHRRVDLISSPYDRYASAVLSWSGSMMFERDFKRYSENIRGYKFRAGLLRMSDGEEVNLETERDIFRFLGLRYVPPELRNAD
ncbi:hypothetical protein IAU60_003941 [Kwoniella sp. DSM 27419]